MSRSKAHGHLHGVPACFQAFDPPLFAGFLQLAVSLLMNDFSSAFQHVPGRNIPDGSVKPDVVVMLDEPLGQAPSVLDRQRRPRPQALALDRAMPALQLAIALGIVGRGSHMRHAANSNEFLEVFGDELWPIVRDDPRPSPGKLLARPLNHDL